MKIPTIEECRELGYEVRLYTKGDYKYKISHSKGGLWHIIREGKEIVAGRCAELYPDGKFSYMDYNSVHLIQDGEEIARGTCVWVHSNGDYSYRSKDGIKHRRDKTGKKVRTRSLFEA